MFILNAIKKIKNSKRVLFTTPTHLQGDIIPTGLKKLIGYKAFKSDFSEVEGLDNIKHPESCIKKSQEWASDIYGTKKTFYLTNGSSSGVIALMMSVIKNNDKVLLPRNIHESIVNGLILTGAIPVWFLPDYNEEYGINKGITLKQISNEYTKNPDIKLLIITSPTYEGVVSEVKEIAKFCKEKNIIFIVDEAHGALFPFSEKLPISAINCGVDACVQSLHKTTPALTGTALVHICKNSKIDEIKVQDNLNLINSTSPSWLLIVSIEGAINYLISKRCKQDIDELLNNIEKLKQTHSEINFLTGNNHDNMKLLFSKENYTGEELSEFLLKNNIEDELVTEKSVLCLCGIGTTKKKLKKLSHVLEKLPKKKFNNVQKIAPYKLSIRHAEFISASLNNNFKKNIVLKIPKRVRNDVICNWQKIAPYKFTPKEAHFADYEIVEKNNAIGRIIAENITPYPPCIPILIKGEVIEEEHLRFLPNFVRVVK